jgi:D-3-phosphoglycerate dehydrogenase
MDLKSCRVLVTATSFGKNDPGLRTSLDEQVGQVTYNKTGKPLSAAQLADLLPGIDGFIAGLDAITADALQAADRLKVISRYGVGIDNVNLEAARQKGIVVTNTPGANSVSVAELAVGLILSLSRHIPEASAAARKGEWPRMSGLSLEGKTAGIIGFGAIGKQLALRLSGFGCRLLAYDPYPDLAFAEKVGVQLMSLDDLLPQADIVSLHLPLLPDTRGLVDREFLAKMKPGALLINTARGEIVDETALYEALMTEHLAGAALDALIQEPPDPNNPLLRLSNVLLTPHMGAHTDGATNAMGWISLQDCLAVLNGEEPRFRVA